MEPMSSDDLQLQLAETTSVLNRLLNLNCSFDGSHLIYLAGAHIVLHNVFQNTKHFTPRATPHPAVALAFHHAAETTVAVLAKTQTRAFLEFYPPDKSPITIELHYDLTVHDCIFLEKRKVAILCHDLSRNTPMLLIVSSNRKLTKTDLSQSLTKFTQGDRRTLVLPGQPEGRGQAEGQEGRSGCFQFSPESELLLKRCYPEQEIRDVVSIEEAEVVVGRDNVLRVFVEGKIVQEVDLREQCGRGEWGCGTRVGRSILVAFKGELSLGHLVWGEGRLRWVGLFEYPQRLRANIVCMQPSADEMNIVIGAQIYHKDSWKMEFFLFNCGALSSEKKFVDALTRMVPTGAETGDINSLQSLISSEVFLLAGPSIVGYSYVDHIEKKHKYVIHESPRLIAVHPLGYQILCTFEGAVKFYQKVELELLEIWTEPWTCSAAKYTQSGLLLVCVYEEGSHHILLYDPNSFRALRHYGNLYIKHAVTAIELDETETEMMLWCGRDLMVYRVKTGEKLSEFREKKEGYEANCVGYDPQRKMVLVGDKDGLVVCRKNEDYHLNFSVQKKIRLEEEITCLRIQESCETVFMGTADGKVLFSPYPLTPVEDTLCDHPVCSLEYRSVRVHSSPITELLLTNNSKYLFAVARGEGLGVIRVRKNIGLGNRYSAFDISNYNFIETSSKPYLTNVQEKLKGLLEKRKTIFNELEEYKKEWEGRRQREGRQASVEQKKKELIAVNAALGDIARVKEEHERLLGELRELQGRAAEGVSQGELTHTEDLLGCYRKNDKLRDKREEVELRCRGEFELIQEECLSNLAGIEQELSAKFADFESNYQVMRHNLLSFALRAEIEAEEEVVLDEEEITQTRARLRGQEDELYRRNNELKGQITRNKKQLERFLNRRDFLENKQRFFRQELKFCTGEHSELRQIKQELSQQLRQLESDTYKKEKCLRKYFIENEMLLKYQVVHENLTKTTERETAFMEDTQATLKQNISQLQREIILISDRKGVVAKHTAQKQQEMLAARQHLKRLKGKSDYLWLQVKELERLLATVGPGRQQQLQGLYQRFFVDKHLEASLEHPRSHPSRGEKGSPESHQVEKKIQEELEAHKQYLMSRMGTFERTNAKAFEQIQLSHLKYQGENYALISECNVRKEQIGKKKRVIQDMVNSVRETQNYMAQLQGKQDGAKGFKMPHLMNPPAKQDSQPLAQPPRTIPFFQYEKQQAAGRLRKEQSEPSLHHSKHKPSQSQGQLRRMLDVQRVTCPESRVKPIRRIQTACLKGKATESAAEPAVEEDAGGWMITKPQTAGRRGRGAQQQARRLFSRNKSSSKPTTCTHSKY